MRHIITVQHTQSVHHTNGMVGSWTDWDLTELGRSQADRIGKKLKDELAGKKVVMFSSDLKREADGGRDREIPGRAAFPKAGVKREKSG